MNSRKERRDVIVIGAGMAGILIAYYLQKEGKDVLVLEANEIASGQTGRTTAKITSQHNLKYKNLIKQVGARKARIYAEANEAAIEEYEKLIREENIDCQFERTTAYLYTREDKRVLWEEAQAAAYLGIRTFFSRKSDLPFSVSSVVGFRKQAQFVASDFVAHISKKLKIREHTKVIKIRGNQVITKDEVFVADKIVVATHYPFKNVPGFYFLRQHQERSYVLALKGPDKINGMYLGIDADGISFRQMGEHLLLGGSSHRTGKNLVGGAYDFLDCVARKYYPQCKEVGRWSAQDCVPHDGIPFIGKYSIFTPNLYVATGFQKWGMTSSMVAAMILKEEICGRKSPYDKVFSPQRVNIRASAKNFFIDMVESTIGIVKGIFRKSKPRCSHLGCELEWNPDEQSWDCPCHGSRFDENGEIMDNPALKGIRQ